VDSPIKVPLLWGTDAVHGHSNVHGATIFPHNIGLGAAHDVALAARVAQATGRAVRATGIQWVFAPTLAVARDDRWGRTYESFAEDPAQVRAYGQAVVAGLQAGPDADARVVATAKHFIGDGGTEFGRDQGVTPAAPAELIAVHGQGYLGALDAGVQTVMVSFNSWNAIAEGRDPGKLHGSRALISGLLKEHLGFDGLVVSDWNGIAQVPGCGNASCAQAINAGIDMVMVPDDWRDFITNTLALVRSGQIPLSRIDDAVSRILRVKLRAGLFEQRPSGSVHAGRDSALLERDLAREAVRKSLVLLKNNAGVLPLSRRQRVLVVGDSADSIANQSGGWTLSWQGTGNSNADFPHAQSILAGLQQALGAGQVVYSPDARGIDVSAFDAVVAVVGETPYAEGRGDIPPSGTLQHSSRYPQDLAVLKAVTGRGRPVVTVLLSGRPLYVNDLLNRSDAFVAAWLPGSEGAGLADVLLRGTDGGVAHDFQGSLSFSWPARICQTPLNRGDGGYAPLYALGHGLRYAGPPAALQAALPEDPQPQGGCGAQSGLAIFNQTAQPPYSLQLKSPHDRWQPTDIALDPNSVIELPDAQIRTVQIQTQQDAQRVAWRGPARLQAWSASAAVLSQYRDAALMFDVRVEVAPTSTVALGMGCGEACGGAVDLSRVLRGLPLQMARTLKIPLACLVRAGVDLGHVERPFSLDATAPFTAAFAQIHIASGAALDADALACAELPPVPATERP
jgi:beta-glucosidase